MAVPRQDLSKMLMTLGRMLTESRRQKIRSVVSSRTRTLAVLLENVRDAGNENAVVRSMDAFGVLSLHRVVTPPMPTIKAKHHKQARTDAGARRWVETKNWNNLVDCISVLKEDGFVVASTCPDSSFNITDIDFCRKTVIAFGNEGVGVSEDLANMSDVQFSLPMCGFVESLNISVCVAVTLYHAYVQRVQMGNNGDLSKEEQDELLLQYYVKSLCCSEQELKHTSA